MRLLLLPMFGWMEETNFRLEKISWLDPAAAMFRLKRLSSGQLDGSCS